MKIMTNFWKFKEKFFEILKVKIMVLRIVS